MGMSLERVMQEIVSLLPGEKVLWASFTTDYPKVRDQQMQLLRVRVFYRGL